VSFDDLLADGTLTMENYDRLIRAMRGANEAIDTMRDLADWIRAEKRLRSMEVNLGIPVSPITHAYLAAGHAALTEALV
jgi:hypothetical protein